MNRESRRDLIETIGIIAVVVSLIVLIVEVRQNTNVLYTESRQVLLESSVNDLMLQFNNPDIHLTMVKPLPLTAEEQIRLDTFWSASLKAREFAWLQYQDGVIDSNLYKTELAILGVIFDSSRARLWWSKLGHQYYSPEFAEFVEDEIGKIPATDTLWETAHKWADE
jgi:hypothetical protein